MLDTSFTRTTGPAMGRFIHPARRRQRVQLDGQDLQASRTSSALGSSGQTSCQSGAGPRRRRCRRRRRVTTKGNGPVVAVSCGEVKGQVYQPKQLISFH
jgi:hypothetical protein